MRASVVVEGNPGLDATPGASAAGEGMQVDALALQGAPQAFDKDVVEVASAPIHRAREPPGQHLAAPPVHDGDQIEEALRQRNVGDVAAPVAWQAMATSPRRTPGLAG